MADFFNISSMVVGCLFSLFLGYVIGASVAEHNVRKRAERKKLRDEGVLKGMTSAEAYLSGFNDAYYGKGNRIKMFHAVGFGERYDVGYASGKEKSRAESEHEDRING